MEKNNALLVMFLNNQSISIKKIRHNNKIYAIEKTNFVHISKEGASKLMHFSLTSGANNFKATLNCENLNWLISEV
mgnify:CR=1 FL=1